ncbi:helicase-related protein [Rhodoplanes sp. Z2-YC6860]|uniref:helicase-related protein n=1 Tax=Rhodoplanes sp. Z2-YC6860 TaxID=674703 RepID=UPI00078C1E8F|nr:helicase-related protein [Rhodoplanes sp. Z2-YC6860]AMN39048.1 DEAD/DEAH box helicase [Rhodoplanes sp. Z2-YC6860]
MTTQPKPDADEVCQSLRDFQRATVDYAFRRLYLDLDRVDRFLVADEVGLGKTWVAKGVIARAVTHLWDKKKRIDVLYICSNAEIARQNVNRLNLGDSKDQAFASRLTLLPLHLRDLNERKVNFISFTPGTSLDFGTSSGARRERAVLYWLLDDIWGLRGTAAMNLLQANAGIESWRRLLDEVKSEIVEQGGFEPAVVQRFNEALIADPSLASDFEEQSQLFGRARKRLVPYEQRHARNQLIARLRRALARSCLAVFEPDLIILDEFQRFRNLLQTGDTRDEAAQLAQQLFASAGSKILLLSATPYKMYTVTGETDGDDHCRDFLETSRFLLAKKPEDVDQLEKNLVTYRKALCGQDIGIPEQDALNAIERCLRNVMCRTERLAATADRNGMLKEVRAALVPMVSGDFLEYRLLSKLASQVRADDPIELWKSSPYLINIMEESYRLKSLLHDAIESQEQPILTALRDLLPWQLPAKVMEAYQPIDPKNPRLRTLIEDLAQSQLWKLLWLPADLPYYEAQGVFAGTDDHPHTKQLIFSSWKVVPRSIAMLVSYAMERLMVIEGDAEPSYSELREKHGPLLRWSEEDGRLGGMPLHALFYPCMTLARRIDPLVHAQAQSMRLTRTELDQRVAKEVSDLLSPLVGGYEDKSARPDQRWYWAAPLLLDKQHAPSVREWMLEESDEWSWASPDDEEQSLFQKHIAEASELVARPNRLGRPPEDLANVLAKIAIGAPGTVILRALLRHADSAEERAAWQSAASAALGFRTLFNVPESMLLLRGLFGRKLPYWDQVLSYCCDGNLQAVIDEYVHILIDLLSVKHGTGEGLHNLGKAIGNAVSLHTTSLAYDHYRPASDGGVSVKSQRVRCRFAQRFGDSDSEDGSEKTREGALRDAFNSPFRPFILASTSIGQEGLDFHPYCHALVHWNLPTNPVDLEQREGRIHRFKGHFIRKNLARAYGIEGTKGSRDPWASIFRTALDRRPDAQNDMVPFWIFDGPSKIERRLPMLPLSRETTRIDDLKQSLALYRMTFGQPRQEELLEFLKRHSPKDAGDPDPSGRNIDLRPR